MAKSGADVLGIDYSEPSIEIAEKNFGGRLLNLKYKKVDFFELDAAAGFSGFSFDKIVASDLVEHIDAELFEKFLERIAAYLNKGGRFILHTAPNKYVYSYKYKRDRLKAGELGLYMPENPRPFYESLMHINEQTPGGLKKALKKYFKYVCVWTANTEEPAGDLSKKPSKNGLISHRSIFAVASNININKQCLINAIMQDELNDISGISLELIPGFPYAKKIKKNAVHTFKLKLINNAGYSLKSLGKTPVHLSYHIRSSDDGNYIVYDGIRTNLPSVIYPKEALEADFIVQATGCAGKVTIEFTMLQEGVFWFENRKEGFIRTLEVEILY